MQKRFGKSLKRMLFAIATMVSVSAWAAPAWTTGNCAPADWQPFEDNVLLNVKGSTTADGVPGYTSGNPAVLTDGQVPAAAPDKPGIFGFRVNENISWTFASPKTLSQIRICSCYLTGAAYDGVHIAKVEVSYDGGSSWAQIAGDSEYKGESQGKINYAVLSNGDDPVAQNITGLKITFGTCETGFANYYAEIEAVGGTGVTGPALGTVSVSPGKTKATLAGTVVDCGTDATACDVYLALGAAADALGSANKVAQGVTGAFSYTIPSLTPDTTYYYALSVSNNAEKAKGTMVNGDFTTLSNEAVSASWTTSDYIPEAWAAVRGNLLARLEPISSSGVSPYACRDVTKLVDGTVPVGSDAIKSTVVGFSPNGTIAWSFTEPKAIEQIRISSLWENTWYNGISINAVSVRYNDYDDWMDLALPTISWTGGSKIGQCAVLADPEAGCLAEGVVGLKLTFGAQKAAVANYYGEIEAIGYASEGEESAPEFAAPAEVETPLATKAILSAELSSIGNKARYATLSFAIGSSLEDLGTPEVLSDNAFPGVTYGSTLTNLVPNTMYYYSFFAKNDILDTVVTNAGSFMTPRLSQVSCSFDLSSGNVSVQVGGETYTTSDVYSVNQGEEITIAAIPASGYEFLYWDGEGVPATQVSDNPLTLIMLDDCELTPVIREIGLSEDIYWLGGEGAWNDATQWDVGRVPTAGDNVFITAGICTAAEKASAKSLTISQDAVLIVAEPNSGAYGNLTVAGNLTLSGAAELHVAAGPLDFTDYTFATGSGFVTVGGTFSLEDTAKFVPCCDQYTGGGVVTTARIFSLAETASVEAISLGFARFPERTPTSLALGAGTGPWVGASYGGYGDTYTARGAGVAPYGFANAPVHPGSHKVNTDYNAETAGGGNVRIHAGRVELAGKIDVTTEKVASLGAPSGGGIWITSEGKLSVEPTTQFLAKGGNSATDFGNGNGGGGRIALGQRLPAVKVAELAEDGELPVGCSVFELDDFLEVFPEVTVSLEGGHADNKPEDPPMEGCCGTFRYIIGPAPATVLMFK